MSIVFIYITCADQDEAEKIASALVERRLAACANIMRPHKSVYWWEGAVQSGEEVAMIVKTQADLYDKLEAAVKALHSYDTPCIVALPIAQGFAPFLEWVSAETSR